MSPDLRSPLCPPDPSSRWFAHALLVLAVLLPAAGLGWLVTSDPAQWVRLSGVQGSAPTGALRVLAIAIGSVPVLCTAAGLLHGRACLLGFARGEPFAPATIARLRAAAVWMCAGALAGAIAPSLLSLVVSGGRGVSVEVGSGQVLTLVFAGVVWKVAAALEKAFALAEENAQFV